MASAGAKGVWWVPESHGASASERIEKALRESLSEGRVWSSSHLYLFCANLSLYLVDSLLSWVSVGTLELLGISPTTILKPLLVTNSFSASFMFETLDHLSLSASFNKRLELYSSLTLPRKYSQQNHWGNWEHAQYFHY